MPTDTRSAGANEAARLPLLHLLGIAVGGAALQLTPIGAAAQKLRLDLSLESQLAATSNAGLLDDARARSDLVLDLKPRLHAVSRGSGLHLDLTAGVIARSYIQGTQASRVEPEVDMRGRATLVEGWVALDGSVNVSSIGATPVTAGGAFDADLTADSLRESRVVLTPRLQRDLSPEWQLQAYSANDWVRRDEPASSNAVALGTTRSEATVARLARRPVPAGMTVEWRRQRQSNGQVAGDGTVLAIDAARVGVSYRVLPQLVTGLVAGRERSSYRNRDDDDSIVGFSVDWQPNERTWVRGTREKRFFGQGFDVGLGYRSPFVAVSGSWSRLPGASGDTLGSGLAGSDVSALLDSLLTTRIPDPIERADAVDRLITERGLPRRLGQASDVLDSAPQLVRNGALNLVLLGVRHAAAISLFSRSSRELRRDGEVSLAPNPTDFRQRGGTVIFSRRLTPTTSLGATLQQSLTDGQGVRAGEQLRQSRVQADLGIALSSRTRLSVGLGHQVLKSNRFARRSESRAIVGLLQNF